MRKYFFRVTFRRGSVVDFFKAANAAAARERAKKIYPEAVSIVRV